MANVIEALGDIVGAANVTAGADASEAGPETASGQGGSREATSANR